MRTRGELTRLLEKSGIGFLTLESGRSWMIVCPALAARIMGAGVGEENAFWVPSALSTRGWADGGNAGGQRTWIAPEGGPAGFFFSQDGAAWSVARDLDPGHYRAAPPPAGGVSFQAELEARTARGASRRISLVRSMTLEEGSAGLGAAGLALPPAAALTIRFRHELGNVGGSTLNRTIGLWSIIQLPCEVPGTIFFAARHPGASLTSYFGTLPGGSMGHEGSTAWLRVKGGTRFKAGMTPADFAGTVGFVRRARVADTDGAPFIVTIMRFAVDLAGTYVDKFSHVVPSAPANGDAAQAYCDPGTGDRAFCEIESHAPAPLLAPGALEGQDILITIARVDETALRGFLGNEIPL
jgi:hypothetical protein